MLKRLGPLPRFVLGLAGILALLVIAGLWLWLPPGPVLRWEVPTPLYGVWLSASGRSLVAINDREGDNALTVWDVSSGRLRAALPYTHKPAFRMYGIRPMPWLWMSPDDTILVYPWDGDKEQWRVWDLEAGREPFAMSEQGSIFQILPNGEMVLPREGKALSLATGESRSLPAELAELLRNDWSLIDVAGQRLLLRRDKDDHKYVVAVWDLSTGAFCLPPFECSTASRSASTFVITMLDPTGRLLALTNDAATDIWDVTAGTKLLSVRDPMQWLGPWQFSPDGSRLVLQGYDEPMTMLAKPDTMRLWDVAARPPRQIGSDPSVYPMFSPDGKRLFSRSGGVIRDTTTFEEQAVRVPFPAYAYPVVSSDSRFIIGPRPLDAVPTSWLMSWVPRQQNDPGTYLEVVDVATGEVRLSLFRGPESEPRLRHDWDVRRLPSGDQLLVYDQQGVISVWDLPPSRPWWIDYGLPVIFTLLLLLAGRLVWRAFRKPSEAAPC